MGAGHSHALHHHGHSPLHVMAPEVKVLATFLVVLTIALTPREALWAFAIHALVLAALVRLAGLPLGFVARRATVVLPFVTFAVLIPFIGSGEQVTVAGLELSRDGLWAMANVLAKATLGVTASILLAGTTEESRIILGLERLRVPRALTMIASFMLRYLRLLVAELGRMRTAMTARGYDPRWLWQARPIATSAGALFVRGYERGERVHAAMLARGFTGTIPAPRVARATTREWLAVAALVAVTASTLVAAILQQAAT